MQFLNLTRQIEIGANCYVLDLEGKRIVLDCGFHPVQEGSEGLPLLSRLPDDSVDAILVSHAHQDHIGSLPTLMRRHPRAKVFATEPTRQISDVMLHNSVNVMLRMREEQGVSDYPLFTHREVDNGFQRWQSVPLRQRWNLDGDRLSPDEEAPVTFEFFDAGHILGAVGILIRAGGRTIFYSGDVNFDDQTLSRAATFPEEPIDILIIETTRGDTPTREGFSRAGEEARLGAALQAAFESNGTILIPVFALGKTQELMALLARFQREGRLPRAFPLYIGGLSIRLTEIYDQFANQWPRLRPELKLLKTLSPFIVSGKNAHDLPLKSHRIHALTSGMMTEHTLSNLFAERILPSPDHHLFFIGYADPDSPGGRIRSAKQGDYVTLNAKRPPVPLRCNVEEFDLSAHGSRESIRAWVNRVAPRKIILVHGDPPAIEWFRATLSADLPNSEIIVPTPGEAISL